MTDENRIEAKVEAAELNNTTWEQLNPDWLEQGDLTSWFAKSEFDNCPGCGKFEHLEVLNTTYDDEGACVLCRPCQWSAHGETPSEAIKNWNTRATPSPDTHEGMIEKAREFLEASGYCYRPTFGNEPLLSKFMADFAMQVHTPPTDKEKADG